MARDYQSQRHTQQLYERAFCEKKPLRRLLFTSIIATKKKKKRGKRKKKKKDGKWKKKKELQKREGSTSPTYYRV